VSICFLTHVAASDPVEARRRILTTADAYDGQTRPMSEALGVSYCTLLRLLDRLEIREPVRVLWLRRRREKKALRV